MYVVASPTCHAFSVVSVEAASQGNTRWTVLDPQTWVLTGAAGAIARRLRGDLAARARELRLVGLKRVAAEHPAEVSIVADVRDRAAVQSAFRGATGVLHLGGVSDEADFHDLADASIPRRSSSARICLRVRMACTESARSPWRRSAACTPIRVHA